MARQTRTATKRVAKRGRARAVSRRAVRPRYELRDENELEDAVEERASTANDAPSSTAIVTNAKESESMLAQLAENEVVKMAAPFVGAAGGALAVTIATERYGVKREVATFGGAALALAASQSVTGLPRELLQAAATAGVCLGVVEVLQTLRPAWLYRQPAKHEPELRQAAPPPEAITRSDLEQALTNLMKRNEADQVERDKVQAAQLQEVQNLVLSLVTQLREANSEVQRLREAEANYIHAREVAAAEAVIARNAAAYNQERYGRDDSPPVETVDTETEHVDAPIDADADTTDAPTSAPIAPVDEPSSASMVSPDGVSITPDIVKHFAAIYALLDAGERQQMSSAVARMPKEDLARAEAQLMDMTPHAAVDYLRTTVFPSLRLDS